MSQAELLWGEVLVRPAHPGFDIRHVGDRDIPSSSLVLLGVAQLRDLAQFTELGIFRPLKSAPDLKRGWRCAVKDVAQIGMALDHLYPGSVADWTAYNLRQTSATHYRAFASRQTGMYRNTAMLSDTEAMRVAESCCHASLCLKARQWTIHSRELPVARNKNDIPCLEPCALLLELARKSVRWKQDNLLTSLVGTDSLPEAISKIEARIDHPEASARPADFDGPDNPRRLRWILAELKASTLTDDKIDTHSA